MDCRNSLLLGLCLLGAASGCVTQPTVPGGSVSALMGVGPDGKPPVREAGPRKPSAELCVAYGNVCERTAAQLNAEPVRQQRWREEARKSYQRGIELEPNAKAGYVALGQFYLAGEDLERALETYQKGIKKLPKEPALWSELGFCQCRKKDWAAAVECFRKAHELDPENHEYGTQLGLCLARSGRVEESVACLTKVQGAAQAHYNVARMLERLNQPDKSKEHLRLALKAKPDLSAAQEMLARLEGPSAEGGQEAVNAGCEQAAP
jgi:tetratricopeptide (TPR) repeat protein